MAVAEQKLIPSSLRRHVGAPLSTISILVKVFTDEPAAATIALAI
jgi:hypothetical protein